jgi:hypothetical protein
MELHDVAGGEQLHHARLVGAEVSARVLGRLGSRVSGDVQDAPEPQLRILRELAEQAERAVLEVAERPVGGGRPEPVKEVNGSAAKLTEARPVETRVREFGISGQQRLSVRRARTASALRI